MKMIAILMTLLIMKFLISQKETQEFKKHHKAHHNPLKTSYKILNIVQQNTLNKYMLSWLGWGLDGGLMKLNFSLIEYCCHCSCLGLQVVSEVDISLHYDKTYYIS